MNLSYAVWLTVSSGVAVFVAHLAWQRRRVASIASPLFVMMLSLAFWSLTYAISWLAPSEAAAVVWLKLTYVGAVSAPVAFLATVLSFTNRSGWLTRKVYALLLLIPALTIILMWTDPWHHLFFGDYPLTSRGSIYNGGPWFYVNLAYLYGLILTGCLLLIQAHFHSAQIYKRQIYIMLTGALLPWLVNFILLFVPYSAGRLDLTPLVFTGTGLLFAYGIFGYRMMDLIPVSRDVLVENMDDAILVVDTDWRVVDINPKALELADSGLDTPIGKPLGEVFSRWRHIYPNFANVDGRVEIKLDRSPFSTLDLRIITLKDRQERVVGKLVTWRDISAQKQTEEKLRIFFQAVEQNPTSILITDPQGRIEYVNPRLVQLTGYRLEELRGRTPQVFKSGETAGDIYANLWATITGGQVWEGEILNRKKNGQTYWTHQLIAPVLDDQGRVTHYVAMQEDITQRKNAETEMHDLNIRLQGKLTEIETLHVQLREEAIRDGLTRLFNRRYMEETLEREISRGARDPRPISVVMMDVDMFKSINDSLGHQAGDIVLQTLGTLLLENTRTSDIACRFGGDEMVVVMPGATTDVAIARAEEWRNAFSQLRFTFGDEILTATLSLGIATFPDQAKSAIELLTAADKAMYWAKVKRNCVVVYEPFMMARKLNRSDDIR